MVPPSCPELTPCRSCLVGSNVPTLTSRVAFSPSSSLRTLLFTRTFLARRGLSMTCLHPNVWRRMTVEGSSTSTSASTWSRCLTTSIFLSFGLVTRMWSSLRRTPIQVGSSVVAICTLVISLGNASHVEIHYVLCHCATRTASSTPTLQLAITLVGGARATGLVRRVSAWTMSSVMPSFFVRTKVPLLFFQTSMWTSPLRARTMLLWSSRCLLPDILTEMWRILRLMTSPTLPCRCVKLLLTAPMFQCHRPTLFRRLTRLPIV